MNAALMLAFAATLVAGVPVAFTMVVGGFAAVLARGSIDPIAGVQQMFAGIDSFPLMAIPFFILAAEIMTGGALTEVLLRFARQLVGHIRGGLGHTTILTLTFFSGISGSALADAAGPGRMLFQMMKKAGYGEGYSASLVASVSLLGPIIPPSIIMIVYALTEPSVTIMGMFFGGVVPGPDDRLRLPRVQPLHQRPSGLPLRRRARDPARARARLRPRAARAADAGDHPGRHPPRRVHADRGVGRGRLLRAGRRPVRLPHADVRTCCRRSCSARRS